MHPGKRVSSSKAECLFGALGAVLTPEQPVHASEIRSRATRPMHRQHRTAIRHASSDFSG